MKNLNKPYCYAKASTYTDMSIGEVWCMKLFRSQDDERLPGFFETSHDAEVAKNLLNNLYERIKR